MNPEVCQGQKRAAAFAKAVATTENLALENQFKQENRERGLVASLSAYGGFPLQGRRHPA